MMDWWRWLFDTAQPQKKQLPLLRHAEDSQLPLLPWLAAVVRASEQQAKRRLVLEHVAAVTRRHAALVE
jgi:hypothetical protein